MGQRDVNAVSPSDVLKLLHVVIDSWVGRSRRDIFPLPAELVLDLQESSALAVQLPPVQS